MASTSERVAEANGSGTLRQQKDRTSRLSEQPMPQHELSTAGPPPDEQDRPSNLMSLHHTSAASGLGVSWTPDECDLLGACTYPHNRMTQLVAELFRRTGELGANAKRVNDRVQAQPDRVLVDAIMADTFALQRQVGMLFDENKGLRQELADLRAVVQVLHRRERAA